MYVDLFVRLFINISVLYDTPVALFKKMLFKRHRNRYAPVLAARTAKRNHQL